MSVINTNIPTAANALSLNRSQETLGRSLTRLSSGAKSITAADDAASLATSEKLAIQSGRAKVTATQVQDAVSRVQASDGLLEDMSRVLTRMGDLATLSAEGTQGASDSARYQQEFSTLQDRLRNTIGGTTAEIGGSTDVDVPLGTFQGAPLFGASPAGLTVAVGRGAGEDVTIADTNLRRGGMLGVIQQDPAGAYTLDVRDADALQKIRGGMEHVATERALLGKAQSRLEFASTTLSVEVGNLSSAMSEIRDAGVAEKSTQSASRHIRDQPGAAMLSQANQAPKTVLQLLQD